MSTKCVATTLLATSFLLAGIGAAHAEGFQTASPEKTPMITTPHVSTPAVATPDVTTPGETADATVQPIQLPAGADAELGGLVERTVSTPDATPQLHAAPEVPALTVATIGVPSVAVDEIPVQADLPAAATAGTDGVHAWTSGLPTTVNASQGDGGVSMHAGPVSVSIGLDG